MDDEILRLTNTMILGQVGKPPPTCLLLAVLEAAGGEVPLALHAHASFPDGSTQWTIKGVAVGAAFEVSGLSNLGNWVAGHPEENRGDSVVSSSVFRLSSVLKAAFRHSHTHVGQFDRRDSQIVGSWIFTFLTKDTLGISTETEDGRDVAERILEALRQV